MWDPNDKMVKW